MFLCPAIIGRVSPLGAPPYSNLHIKYNVLVQFPTQAGHIKFRADKESYNAR